MSFNFISGSAILYKAGSGVNSSLTGGAVIVRQFCDESEAELCALTKYDWVTNKASIGTNYVNAIADVVGDLVAIKCINYDMSGYTSTTEAQTMISVLYDSAQRKIKALTEDKIKTNMGAS